MPPEPFRRLGATDLDVHALCLGGNVFGWTADRDASFAVLDAYLEAGGNFVDTADQYSAWVPGNAGGESETLIGEWLAERGCRDRIVLASKVGWGYEGFDGGLRREQILAGCDASLRRLGVEQIDLYYAHKDDPDTPLDETLGAFDELVQAGKVRYVAASNYTAERLRAALDASAANVVASFVAFQPQLNLIDRDGFPEDARRVCQEAGLGVAAYSALASGFLTGKYQRGQEPQTGRAWAIKSRYLTDERAWSILDATERVAQRHAVTTAQAALAWVAAQPGVTSAIASATSPEQLAELLAGVRLELGAQDLRELDEAHERSGPTSA